MSISYDPASKAWSHWECSCIQGQQFDDSCKHVNAFFIVLVQKENPAEAIKRGLSNKRKSITRVGAAAAAKEEKQASAAAAAAGAAAPAAAAAAASSSPAPAPLAVATSANARATQAALARAAASRTTTTATPAAASTAAAAAPSTLVRMTSPCKDLTAGGMLPAGSTHRAAAAAASAVPSRAGVAVAPATGAHS